MASVAQAESESISENVKWAIRKVFQKGIGNTKRRTFGYHWVEGTMIVIQKESDEHGGAATVLCEGHL